MPSKYIEFKSYQNLGSTPAFTCLCRTVQSYSYCSRERKIAGEHINDSKYLTRTECLPNCQVSVESYTIHKKDSLINISFT